MAKTDNDLQRLISTRQCPTCGHVYPGKPKATKPSPAMDIDAMSDAELFAYRKRTAIAGDLAFVRAISSPALQAHIDGLVKPSKADCARVTCMWRMERGAADRAANVPAIGSPRWVEALESSELAEVA